jgi:acyl-CoA thioester hydrolase
MPPFEFDIRVYYEDTDAQGVVYYANYLKYLERARSEWLRRSGIPVSHLATGQNLVFVVRRVEIDYMAAAKLDDVLSVTVELSEISKVSFKLNQNILRQDQLLTRATLKLACLDATKFKPVRIPDKINKLIQTRH